MARVLVGDTWVKLWLSANDTYNWAHRPNRGWPCSSLAGHRLFAEFSNGNLVDLTIDGRSDIDCDSTEFDAITSDFLAKKLPKDHPCYPLNVS